MKIKDVIDQSDLFENKDVSNKFSSLSPEQLKLELFEQFKNLKHLSPRNMEDIDKDLKKYARAYSATCSDIINIVKEMSKKGMT